MELVFYSGVRDVLLDLLDYLNSVVFDSGLEAWET